MTTEVSGQPVVQLENASGQAIPQGGVQGEQKPPEPKYATREEVIAIAQSLTDKASNRVKTDLENLRKTIELQKSAGIQITPEQQQAAEMQVITQSIAGGQTEAPASPAPVGVPGVNTPVDPMKYLTDQQTAANITIDPGDPEAAILKGSVGPFDWGLKVAEAISAKRARLSNQSNQATARIPAGGGTPPGTPPPASAHEAWERAHPSK